MVISHRHRYLFVEVPFTASTSISAKLRNNYDGERILWKHANLSQFMRRAGKEERQYFVFGTVRNPLDWIVSDYVKLASNQQEQYTTPERFARNGGWVSDEDLEKFRFIQENSADFPRFFRRYFRHIYNNWTLLMSDRYEYVVRFENLQRDFDEVLRRLGLEKAGDLPMVNRTLAKKRNFADFYPPDTRDQAVRCFGPFMQKWGYEFPPEWGEVRVPLRSRARFKLFDGTVNRLGRYVDLSAHSAIQQRIKKAVQ